MGPRDSFFLMTVGTGKGGGWEVVLYIRDEQIRDEQLPCIYNPRSCAFGNYEYGA